MKILSSVVGDRRGRFSPGAGAASRADDGPPGNAEEGKKLYASYGCYQCHGYEAQGSNATGPRLGPRPIAFAAFSRYVRQPTGQMPPYTTKVVSDADLAQHLRVRAVEAGAGDEHSAVEIKAGLKTRLYEPASTMRRGAVFRPAVYFSRLSTNSCAGASPPSAFRDIAISSPLSVPLQLRVTGLPPPRPCCCVLNFSAVPAIVPS